MMISILDCNLGNIGTLVSKISLLTDNFQVTQKYQDLKKSEKLYSWCRKFQICDRVFK